LDCTKAGLNTLLSKLRKTRSTDHGTGKQKCTMAAVETGSCHSSK